MVSMPGKTRPGPFNYFLGTNIKVAGPEIERRLLYCNLSVYAGGKELTRYIEFLNSSGRGLAGTSMGTSVYSNVRVNRWACYWRIQQPGK